MKKTILFSITISALLTIFIASCKKDPCENKSCLNGGVCNDGTCNCPTGYHGVNCEIYDPCYGVTCLNCGVCGGNGACLCPVGYTGADCGTIMTPVSLTINSIVLTSYPMTTGAGAGWDLSDGPDVFLSINPGITANDVQFSDIFYDVIGWAISYETYFPITLVNPDNNYTIGVWDYDTPDPDDLIGGIYFTPNDFKSGFPSTIHLTGGSLDMTLYVAWHF